MTQKHKKITLLCKENTDGKDIALPLWREDSSTGSLEVVMRYNGDVRHPHFMLQAHSTPCSHCGLGCALVFLSFFLEFPFTPFTQWFSSCWAF